MKHSNTPVRRHHSRYVLALAWLGSCAALVAPGCAQMDDGVEDLGSTGQDQESPPPEPQDVFYGDPASFIGRWIGEAEEPLGFDASGARPPVYRFPSGSTQIVLDLRANDDPAGAPASVIGTIVFGDGEPPLPPTDPDVGYPPGVSYVSTLVYAHGDNDVWAAMYDNQPLPPLEGFPYPTVNVALPSEQGSGDFIGAPAPDGVLRLLYHTNDYLEPWCRLQTPVLDRDGSYQCLPETVGVAYQSPNGGCFSGVFGPDGETLEEVELDCDKLVLCGATDNGPLAHRRCSCDETSCWVEGAHDQGILSLRRNGDTLTGAIADGWFSNRRGLRVQLGTLRFRRAE
jgi:hypothetical protein